MQICIIGAGYVGLSTALALGLAGHQVLVVERNLERLERLQNGEIPFFEPHFAEALAMVRPNLRFSETPEFAPVVFLAVGTPSTPAHGVDTSQVFAALEQLVPLMQKPAVVVLKSTVPVGTHLEAHDWLEQHGAKAVSLVGNPEFLRQGRALRDAVFPDRIVLGSQDPSAFELLASIYAPIVSGQVRVPAALEPYRPKVTIPIIKVSPASAELCKYAANAFLAMKISFINEIANVSERVGADVDEIRAVLATDTRIGAEFLQPGLGYGGSCFPKDTRALSQMAAKSGYEFRLLRSVIEVNQAQRYRLLDKLEQVLGGLRGRRVSVLGLTFKPNTDDLRESLGVDIALELLARGARVCAHDPLAAAKAQTLLPNAEVSDNLEASLTQADAAILVTEWADYQHADWQHLALLMKQKIIFDGRNALSKTALLKFGYAVYQVGKGGGGMNSTTETTW
jgi:UDPglucose 6-dehydrogenase